MEPNQYQLIMIFVVGALWLGGVGLIIFSVVGKKKLPWVDMFDPLIIFKFDAKDWGKLLLLILIVVGLFYFTIILGPL